jgi:hypothetical protein
MVRVGANTTDERPQALHPPTATTRTAEFVLKEMERFRAGQIMRSEPRIIPCRQAGITAMSSRHNRDLGRAARPERRAGHEELWENVVLKLVLS